ncbi:MAG TPA: hypothetical protein VGN11_05720 [Candidatus Baltobacteraceae bacterium]|nr:hypothetical protein [Candidatus Baltobacteraceae bacterium]
MLRACAIIVVALGLLGAVAQAEPGLPAPVVRPSVELQTAMPDDDGTIVRPGPPSTPSPSPSPSPSASP